MVQSRQRRAVGRNRGAVLVDMREWDIACYMDKLEGLHAWVGIDLASLHCAVGLRVSGSRVAGSIGLSCF